MLVENIRALCKGRELTLAELERKTGIGNGVIARWATSSPRVDNLAKVADYFGVTVDDLLSDNDTSNSVR